MTALDLDEDRLLRLALQLGAERCGGPLSQAEAVLAAGCARQPALCDRLVREVLAAIQAGADPLGERLCRLRSPAARRPLGAFYTPPELVAPMVRWTLDQRPRRVVDAGCGSGRFAAAVVRDEPDVELVAVDLNPAATLLTRAVLAALGARSVRVLQADYTRIELPRCGGRTAFIGNPPYVRHHHLPPAAKRWIVESSRRLGYRASGLAGLHAHFFVATALHARDGDVGCLVTSSEWLDVNYGSVVRHLLANGLGGRALSLVSPTEAAFKDAQTTAVVTCFEKGWRGPSVRIQWVENAAELSALERGEQVDVERLATASRWSRLWSAAPPALDGQVVLGDLARVSRGLVTGANDFFVMTRARARELGIEGWCRTAITDAREVLTAGGVVRGGPERSVVLDLPRDFDRPRHPAVHAYLRSGERAALAGRYICSHRRPWWCLGRQEPAPIVASYMARQAPAFASNPDGLLVLNIAHCVYPRQQANADQLVARLNSARESFRGQGRTYQGGLEKFEPREMEALPIPPL